MNRKRLNSAAMLLSFLWFAPGAGAAQFAYSDFRSIREAALGKGGAAPAVSGGVLRVDYGIVSGPVIPKTQHLKPEQLQAFLDGLPTALTEHGKARLKEGLLELDKLFVDPISAEDWDKILPALSELAAGEFGKDDADEGAIVDELVQAAVRATKDPHSEYLNPELAARRTAHGFGKLVGIGVLISKNDLGLGIDNVYPESGAERAGLRPGDVVTWVRQDSPGDKGRLMAGVPLRDIVEQVSGMAGTKVFLKVLRNGRLVGPIAVQRAALSIPNTYSRIVAPGIGYVYFGGFTRGSGQRVLDLLQELYDQGARAFILDVRNNGGGFVPEVSLLISEFLKDKETIVAFKHQGRLDYKAVAKGDGKYLGARIAVLVNGNSASASEILAATLQDHGQVVVGDRSFGKGSEQVTRFESDGRQLTVTENRWYSSADRNISAQGDPETGEEIPGTGGVEPNILVDVPKEQDREVMQQILERLYKRQVKNPVDDPVLDAAIQALSSPAGG